MKKQNLFTALALVVALAAPLAQAAEQPVASSLRTLKINVTSNQGVVLHTRGSVNKTHQVVVGIPASIDLGDACTKFVGQQETQLSGVAPVSIQALGATSPVVDACIAVMPLPEQTNLTLVFNVADDLPVAQISQRVLVGSDVYLVTLELTNETVSLQRVN